jgi:hypothetical protein
MAGMLAEETCRGMLPTVVAGTQVLTTSIAGMMPSRMMGRPMPPGTMAPDWATLRRQIRVMRVGMDGIRGTMAVRTDRGIRLHRTR